MKETDNIDCNIYHGHEFRVQLFQPVVEHLQPQTAHDSVNPLQKVFCSALLTTSRSWFQHSPKNIFWWGEEFFSRGDRFISDFLLESLDSDSNGAESSFAEGLESSLFYALWVGNTIILVPVTWYRGYMKKKKRKKRTMTCVNSFSMSIYENLLIKCFQTPGAHSMRWI